MKILQITDIEGYRPIISDDIFENLDYVIISGDISIGSRSIKRTGKVFQRVRDSIPLEIPIYYIPGNREYESVSTIFEGIPENFHPFHNKSIKLESNASDVNETIWIVGFGGTIPGILNNFIHTEEEIEKALKQLFSELNGLKKPHERVILVTHDPPFNSGLDKTFRGMHVGSKSVRSAIEKFQPDLFICGHIHESQGIEMIGSTICVNPGASREGNANLILIEKEIKTNLIKIDAKRL